ncbi:MAG: cache domain-containing protein [Stellaceae bacterium]
MEMRIKTLLPLVALVAALTFGGAANAQQSGTADEAKALLARAAAAVKADKASALAKFDNQNGGFKDRDLYVFCFDRRSGIVLAGPPTVKGKDQRTLRDPTGKMFGQEMFANVKDGEVITEDYMFPKPNSTVPVAKESFVEGLGDVACGVGYYTTSAEAAGDLSRTAREQHACTVIMGLQQGEALYSTCIRSLGEALFALDQARLIATEQNACARFGLKPGTPSFAACVENGPGF